MAFWSMIPMLASLGTSSMGAEAARTSTVEGAKSQAKIEAMKREYGKKIFAEDTERLRPFYEAGAKAGVQYGEAIKNRLDPTKTGTYQQIKSMIEPDLEGAPDYVREDALERLGAVEGERQKGRLMDIQQIGLGSAGSAGTSRLNLGSMLAQSYGLSGGVMATGAQQGADQRQSMWNQAASGLSGIPAYMSASQQPSQQPATYTGPGYQGGMSSYTLNQGIR